MRHIPEEELHAYLDQALSRSQCVEIESHVAACASCRAARDGIAALRDRTTSLLSALAPSPRVTPSYETIRARHAAAALDRRHRARAVAWAASVVVAVGLGYGTHAVLDPRFGRPAGPEAGTRPSTAIAPSPIEVPSVAPAPSQSLPAPAPVAPSRPESSPVATADRRVPTNPPAMSSAPRSNGAVARAKTGAPSAASRQPPIARVEQPEPTKPSDSTVVEPPAVELSSLRFPKPETELDLDGLWRDLSWDNARAETGEAPPRIDGLPVVQVQVQQSQGGDKPLMVVAQQLSSGEVIRTIEGSVADVSKLLARRTTASTTLRALPSDSVDGTSMRRGDRMLVVTGDLPPDSLRAMIRRLNPGLKRR